MKKARQRLVKRLAAGILIFSMTLCSAVTGSAYTANTKILPAVITSSSTKELVLVGIKGRYLTDTKDAVDKINEIRLEACREGVTDPRDSSRRLTESDYVPIQWSSELEKAARIRAAEASFILEHIRPNGGLFSDLFSGEGGYCAENLAWNFYSSVIYGIIQWYEEKDDWVNQTPGAVTGHYTSMINPAYNYVGLGCMLSSYGTFYNTTCGEFAYSPSALDTMMGEDIEDCIQMIEVQPTMLSDDVIINTGLEYSDDDFKVGDTADFELTVGNLDPFSYSRALVMDDVKWTTSDEKIATVDEYGTVTGVGKGTVKITAFYGSGLSAESTLTVTAKAGKDVSKKEKTPKTVTPPKVSRVKSLKAKAGGRKLTITWKKVSGVTGYQLQISKKSSFRGAKSVNISKSKKKYIAKKLKKNKKYYVRIRAFKTYRNENGKTKKAYGDWVKVSKKTK